jgi:hypothetical protein
VSSVSNGASVSGLFILGYPSVFSNVYLRLAIPKLKCPKVVQHLVITIRYVIIDVSYLYSDDLRKYSNETISG